VPKGNPNNSYEPCYYVLYAQHGVPLPRINKHQIICIFTRSKTANILPLLDAKFVKGSQYFQVARGEPGYTTRAKYSTREQISLRNLVLIFE
jgi:hypothetical protein